jgi:CPA2 family monovalent cation:H+ antiporter-2
VALSSSVVIVNITVSRRRTTDTATETALLGWSVLQDLVGVALAAILLAAIDPGGRSLPEAAVGLVGFALVAVVVARGALPLVLRGLRDEHDLFLITSVGSGLALAGVGAAIFGVPLALAAFVGGLAVTESHEASEARARLRPFRDVFAVLFFVAIGTLIDPSRLGEAAPWIGLLLVLVVIAKVGVAWALVRLTGLDVRPLQLAVGLGQIGEFSFVLASAAVAAGAIDAVLYTAIIASVAVSIAVSSIAVRLVPVPKPAAGEVAAGPAG